MWFLFFTSLANPYPKNIKSTQTPIIRPISIKAFTYDFPKGGFKIAVECFIWDILKKSQNWQYNTIIIISQCNNREYYTNSNHLSWLISRIVDSGQHVLKRSDVQLKAPIHNPEKLICIGMNYVDHCLEQNVPLPTEPILFSKFNNAITDPGAPIIYPDETQVCFIVVPSINLICILK